MELTEAGERLRASTAAPLRQLELAVKYAGSPLARLERGLLFGMVPTAAGVLAAPLLASLGTAFPNVHFHVAVAETDDLVLRMLSGAVDLAVINPVPVDRLFYRHLLVEDLVLVGGPTSDLTPETPVRFADLARLPLVMPSAQTGIRNTLENTALRVKVAITARYSTDSLEVSTPPGLGGTRLRSAAAGGLWRQTSTPDGCGGRRSANPKSTTSSAWPRPPRWSCLASSRRRSGSCCAKRFRG